MAEKYSQHPFYLEQPYLSLPEKFYSRVAPAVAPDPQNFIFNHHLQKELGMDVLDDKLLTSVLSGNRLPGNSVPIAQAYAGHQFGHFTMLGDGRAVLMGEMLTQRDGRYDIQLKGSGATPYSRGGDGKATLRAMLREYLFSEALHSLGIPGSRSLAVTTTGEPVYREEISKGAVLTRLMRSHIRVGTFEFAGHLGSREDLKALTDYTIDRYFPELKDEKIPALQLLKRVMHLQIDLVVEWMRVGFIHGVMNTDNTSITGETFDYGPCAFMNTYEPATVYSSIDHGGRYSFGNQPGILKWNLAMLAEALLPLIDSDEKRAVELAINQINLFDDIYKEAWYRMMFRKIGIDSESPGDRILVDELLNVMEKHKLDYTNTFLFLEDDDRGVPVNPEIYYSLSGWLAKWKARITSNKHKEETKKKLMKSVNPVFVPRNIHVEKALDLADQGDVSMFSKLLTTYKYPYTFKEGSQELLTFDKHYDKQYQTFCGT
jgi:uncharacterized protein YdiU (UPF0061 family)